MPLTIGYTLPACQAARGLHLPSPPGPAGSTPCTAAAFSLVVGQGWSGLGSVVRVRAMVLSICERILERAQQFDSTVEVAAVARRDADDGILVRLATKTAPGGLVDALRDAWPLASVSLVQNRVSGRTEAQVLLPNEAEQRALAKSLAKLTVFQTVLRKVTSLLVVLLAIACLHTAVIRADSWDKQ